MSFRRTLKSPTLHFMALGAILFLASDVAPRATPSLPAREITLDASQLGNRSADELIEEEILVQEALAVGLDRNERIVQARLAAIGGFLELDPEAGAADLAAKARGLGLQETDPIIRRHLASLMRLYLSRLDAPDWPSETDLAEYLAAHTESFSSPSRVRLSHVFLSRDRRGPKLDADVARLQRQLAHSGPRAGTLLGDPFARGSRDITASDRELDVTFGPGFADRISSIAPGRWAGPVESVYGKHFVWIHERIPARSATLAEVRSRVLHLVLAERRDARFRQRLSRIRERYLVRTAWNS